jgi:hypothetical protein
LNESKPEVVVGFEEMIRLASLLCFGSYGKIRLGKGDRVDPKINQNAVQVEENRATVASPAKSDVYTTEKIERG